MDEATLKKIDELVEAFRRAPDEAERRQVTLEAERAFQFVPGALERFAIRVEPIGTARFTPGVLDEADLTASGGVYGEMRDEERAEVERLVTAYQNAESPSERENIALEATRRLDGSPLALRDFRTKAGIATASDISPDAVVREPPPASSQSAFPVPPQSEQQQSGMPMPEETVPMGPRGRVGVERGAGPTEAQTSNGRERIEPRQPQGQSASGQQRNRGPSDFEAGRASLENQQWVEWREAASTFQLLAELGYTGEAAQTIFDQFKELQIPGTLNQWYRSNADGTLTKNQIQDTIAAWATGAGYSPYQVEGMPMSVPPRMATIDGVSRVTDRAGLVGRDGEFLRDENGQIIPGYDANAVQSFLYTQIDQKAYWELADRLHNIGLLADFSPGQIEAAVSNLFSEATKFGYTYDNLLYQKEKTLGVGNGMQQPRLGPSQQDELNLYGESAQQAAMNVFGRRLTDEELRGVIADYEVMRREQPYYARTGATSPSGQVFSIESATDEWLRENRPEQYQRAQDYSSWGSIYDAALKGAFSE